MPNTIPSTIIPTQTFIRSSHAAAKRFFIKAGAMCSSIRSNRSITTTRLFETQGSLKKTRDFYRLFMAPGMGHCFDGPGPNVFNGANNPGNPVDAQDDVVAAVVRWVEQGIAPDKIIASHFTNGVVDTSRPLCPYPEVALHKAAGSTSDASNFVCAGDREQAGQ